MNINDTGWINIPLLPKCLPHTAETTGDISAHHNGTRYMYYWIEEMCDI